MFLKYRQAHDKIYTENQRKKWTWEAKSFLGSIKKIELYILNVHFMCVDIYTYKHQ